MTPRLLIIDDTPDHLESIERYLKLKSPDWEFIRADNVVNGIGIIDEQLRQRKPITVVLTDFELDKSKRDDKGRPIDTGGFTIIEEALKRDPQVSTILYSVFSDIDRKTAFSKGAFDVVERNEEGTAAANEILVKAQRAVRQRESSDRIADLSRFFDRQVFRLIDEDPDFLTLQKRTITICFWDIEGFSRFSEDLKTKPKLIAEFLKQYGDEAARIIFSHDGVLDKFIGDGVMALFGVLRSTSTRDHGASAALQAALELRKRFDEFVKQNQEKWVLGAGGRDVKLGLRCGIHTEEALVGCAGTTFRDQFTALGTAVNKAARFESEADGSIREILISESTKSYVKDTHTLNYVKTVSNIKNIPGDFKLFAVVD